MSSSDLEASLQARNARRLQRLERRQASEAIEQSFNEKISILRDTTASIKEEQQSIQKQLSQLDEKSKTSFTNVLSSIPRQISLRPVERGGDQSRRNSITMNREEWQRLRAEEKEEQKLNSSTSSPPPNNTDRPDRNPPPQPDTKKHNKQQKPGRE